MTYSANESPFTGCFRTTLNGSCPPGNGLKTGSAGKEAGLVSDKTYAALVFSLARIMGRPPDQAARFLILVLVLEPLSIGLALPLWPSGKNRLKNRPEKCRKPAQWLKRQKPINQ